MTFESLIDVEDYNDFEKEIYQASTLFKLFDSE